MPKSYVKKLRCCGLQSGYKNKNELPMNVYLELSHHFLLNKTIKYRVFFKNGLMKFTI